MSASLLFFTFSQDPTAAGFVNAALASGKSALHLAAERGDKVLPLLLKAAGRTAPAGF